MRKNNNKMAFYAILIAAVAFFNTILVIQSVQFTYQQWIGDDAIRELEWVNSNLRNSSRPMIFVIDANISRMTDFIELWRRIIGSFIPNSLIYSGRIDDLLSFREPQFNNTRLQAYAKLYWDELRKQVKYPENLTSIEVVVLSYFYQPITKVELDTRLVQLSYGVYVVKNYTALAPQGV